jgi:hypothetical protein
MERILTQEERIRRAEEIYLRRKNIYGERSKANYDNQTYIKNTKKKEFKLLKKTALQLIICLILYCIFYLIYDTNYSFSEVTINKTNEILNYDYDFGIIYKGIHEKILMLFNNLYKQEDSENIEQEQSDVEENINQNNSESESNENDEFTEENNDTENTDEMSEENTQTSETKETDNLTENYSFINPVSGGYYISSEFGERASTSEIVSSNHKGIDIAIQERNDYKSFDKWDGN